MWRKIRKMIYTDVFFQLEDDTICPPDTFMRLWGLLKQNPRVGFVTAVETGRNALPYTPVRLGVHKIKMKGKKLILRDSFLPETKGVHEIDAAGVYCFVARKEAWDSAFVGYDPVAKAFSVFAMDNVLTYNMKKHGWKLLCDFDIWCGHLQISPDYVIIFTPEQALHYIDLYIQEYDTYAVGLEIKPKGWKPRAYQISKHAECIDLHPDIEGNPEEEIKKIKEEEKKK